MPFDLTLPKSGTTTFGELYSVLRDNFNGLYRLYQTTAWEYGSVTANWTLNSGSAFGYRKDCFGFVYLCGRVYASGAVSSTIATLPEGYRPQTARKFTCGQHYPGTAQDRYYVTVNTDGTIVAEYYVASSWAGYCLDIVSFYTGA